MINQMHNGGFDSFYLLVHIHVGYAQQTGESSILDSKMLGC